MANTHKEIDKEELLAMAHKYCDECMEATKEVATVKGPVKIKERQLPTINYFISHWLRNNEFDFYKRANWYTAMKDTQHPLSDTIKNINTLFEALAENIVANEGKGIFYAKNKLGMTDKMDQNTKVEYTGLNLIIEGKGKPPRTSEKDVV